MYDSVVPVPPLLVAYTPTSVPEDVSVRELDVAQRMQ